MTVEFERQEQRRHQNEASFIGLFSPIIGLSIEPSRVNATCRSSQFLADPLAPELSVLINTRYKPTKTQFAPDDETIWHLHFAEIGTDRASRLRDEVEKFLLLDEETAFDAMNSLYRAGGPTFIEPPAELNDWLHEIQTAIVNWLADQDHLANSHYVKKWWEFWK